MFVSGIVVSLASRSTQDEFISKHLNATDLLERTRDLLLYFRGKLTVDTKYIDFSEALESVV